MSSAAGAALAALAIAAAGGWSIDSLPAGVVRLTQFGERPDWSADGARLLFVEKSLGDVYEIELASRALRPLTHHFHHPGFLRAFYLSNGDLLLVGPRPEHASSPEQARAHSELWVMRGDLSGPPTPLGVGLLEGPAVSRRSLRIAWTTPELAVEAGEIRYSESAPRIAERRRLLELRALGPDALFLETQAWRPPRDAELIFYAAFRRAGGCPAWSCMDPMGIDAASAALTNYAERTGQHGEVEGIFPDGRKILVEREDGVLDQQADPIAAFHATDIWALPLDGEAPIERLTWFAKLPGQGASNGVVSDDGRRLAFQFKRRGPNRMAGSGDGILVMELGGAPAR
jgi:hypothetical protein